MAQANWLGGLVGGALIGIASLLLLLLNGRIAGISGILGAIFIDSSSTERRWRIAFVAGLIGGAGLYGLARGSLPLHLQAEGATLMIAGLLVGFGTRLGSGCTSGHGVCGLARRSPRSLAATATFIGVAVVTVLMTKHWFQ